MHLSQISAARPDSSIGYPQGGRIPPKEAASTLAYVLVEYLADRRVLYILIVIEVVLGDDNIAVTTRYSARKSVIAHGQILDKTY